MFVTSGKIAKPMVELDEERKAALFKRPVPGNFWKDDEEEREKFLNWLWDFEFNLYGLPVPSEVFFLNMPVEKCIDLMKDRENKFTHGQAKDIHEKDKSHLVDAYNAGCEVAKEYNWYEIKCVKDGEIRSIEDIHEEIYNEIKKHI